jgi:hypothetical protein
MDPTTRQGLRETWIGLLYEFASPTKQSWWNGGGPPKVCVSYAELMCGYFDDLDLSDGLEAAVRDGWMSAAEAQATMEFHRRVAAYQEPSSDHPAILADPAWADVVDAARRAWFGLRAMHEDPETLAMMSKLEARWGRIAPANPPQEQPSRDQHIRES